MTTEERPQEPAEGSSVWYKGWEVRWDESIIFCRGWSCDFCVPGSWIASKGRGGSRSPITVTDETFDMVLDEIDALEKANG